MTSYGLNFLITDRFRENAKTKHKLIKKRVWGLSRKLTNKNWETKTNKSENRYRHITRAPQTARKKNLGVFQICLGSERHRKPNWLESVSTAHWCLTQDRQNPYSQELLRERCTYSQMTHNSAKSSPDGHLGHNSGRWLVRVKLGGEPKIGQANTSQVRT